jgi:hypothetical protein
MFRPSTKNIHLVTLFLYNCFLFSVPKATGQAADILHRPPHAGQHPGIQPALTLMCLLRLYPSFYINKPTAGAGGGRGSNPGYYMSVLDAV